MNRREIFAEALKQAIAGGFQISELMVMQYARSFGKTSMANYYINGIIFNKSFAIALWGDGWAWFTEGQSGDTLPSGNYVNYKGHLANMAVADDPIEYLGKNI